MRGVALIIFHTFEGVNFTVEIIDSKKRLKVNAELRQLAFDIKSSVKKPAEEGALVRLALFLGAGASIQSKISGTGGMIRHFKTRIFERYGKNFQNPEEEKAWLAKQSWYNPEENDFCHL
jgi:hypothetical protein